MAKKKEIKLESQQTRGVGEGADPNDPVAIIYDDELIASLNDTDDEGVLKTANTIVPHDIHVRYAAPAPTPSTVEIPVYKGDTSTGELTLLDYKIIGTPGSIINYPSKSDLGITGGTLVSDVSAYKDYGGGNFIYQSLKLTNQSAGATGLVIPDMDHCIPESTLEDTNWVAADKIVVAWNPIG